MAKEKMNYFDYFYKVSELAYEQASFLSETLRNYDYKKIQDSIKVMHDKEHQADMLKKDMIEFLIKDFLPPFDRDDIMAMADLYDNVCDTIDEVLLKMYMFNIKKCRKDVVEIVDAIADTCDKLKGLTYNLNGFKNTQKLLDGIVAVNKAEDVGDHLYLNAVNTLFKETSKNNKTYVAWNNIYDCLENCFDACENAADEVRKVIIKNS